jgi:hypothetical protein
VHNKQEPVEPSDAPWEGFGHRKVYLLKCQSYVPDKIQSVKMNKGQWLQN